MPAHEVTFFRPHDFRVGEKLCIEGSPRAGDWEVVDITARKVKLRCPISSIEVEWARFCYFAAQCEAIEWPQED